MSTVREIAEFAGVSKSTVSLVLNNKPGVSDEMRRVVLEARQFLQNRDRPSNQIAVATPTNGHNTEPTALSVVVLHPPVLSSSYVFSEVLRGIQTAAATYNLHLRLVANDPHPTPQHVAHLYFSDPNLRPDGVLVFGAQQEEPLVEEAHRQGIPCVVLGRRADKYPVSGIGRDEERYGYAATQYLIEMGHRAIAFLGGQQGYDYPQGRVRGYERAMQEAGIALQPAWIQLGDGAIVTQDALEQIPELTAIIYVNDSWASTGLPVIEATGLTIPNDLSVISFDDTDFARNHTPPLTSISYKRFEEGQWAVKMLIDHIQFPHIERVQTIFEAELIERASCAAPCNY